MAAAGSMARMLLLSPATRREASSGAAAFHQQHGQRGRPGQWSNILRALPRQNAYPASRAGAPPPAFVGEDVSFSGLVKSLTCHDPAFAVAKVGRVGGGG